MKQSNLMFICILLFCLLIVSGFTIASLNEKVMYLQQGIALIQDSWGSPEEVDQLQSELHLLRRSCVAVHCLDLPGEIAEQCEAGYIRMVDELLASWEEWGY